VKQFLFFEIRFIENMQQVFITWFCEQKVSANETTKKSYIEFPIDTSLENLFKMVRKPDEVFIKEICIDSKFSKENMKEISDNIFLHYPVAQFLDIPSFDAKLDSLKQEFDQQKWDIRSRTTSA
jgi:hypothetical protein